MSPTPPEELQAESARQADSARTQSALHVMVDSPWTESLLAITDSDGKFKYLCLTAASIGSEKMKLLIEPGRSPFTSAHRGFSTAAPENTMSALEGAWKAGATLAEIDVRLTHDG